jgi:cold shock CspA family protein
VLWCAVHRIRFIGTITRELVPRPRQHDRDGKPLRPTFSNGTLGANAQVLLIGGGPDAAAAAAAPDELKRVEQPLTPPEELSFAAVDVRWREGASAGDDHGHGHGHEHSHGHLLVGDVVEFKIASRGQSRRAVNVVLVRETRAGRVQGVVARVLKESYCFFQVIGRSDDVFARFAEFIDRRVRVHDGLEVEFSISSDAQGKASAVRIAVLPPGTIQVYEVLPDRVRGVVVRDARRAGRGKDGSAAQKG